MCGILGQLNKKNDTSFHAFEDMIASLSHRGPDGFGTYKDTNIILGHKRLSIIDLSTNAAQPMLNDSQDVCITFNGEIYNYIELKAGLKGTYNWKSTSDTEVLLHAYEEYGIDVVKKIDGMFAFAIYDKNKRTLTVARDRFGKKPFYYYLDDTTFCFASELKALLKNPVIKKNLTVNKKSLSKFLFYGYIPSPATIFNEAFKLEAATVMQFDINKWEITHKNSFWNLHTAMEGKNELKDEATIIDEIDTLLRKSVEKRLISDVPVGVFLSGGLDSSLITYYMSTLSEKVNTFSIVYKNSPSADESAYSDLVVKKLGLKSYKCNFEDSVVRSDFIEIMDYLDEPLADAAIIPLYHLAKFAKKNITVALSGDGADELFGGYPKYKAQDSLENFKILSTVSPLLAGVSRKGSNYHKFFSSAQHPFAVRQFMYGSGGFTSKEHKDVLQDIPLEIADIFEDSHRFYNKVADKDAINKSLYLDSMIQIPDWYLVKGDRATMAASLEMRNPFLDTALAEYSFNLPGKLKMKNFESKYLLKKLALQYFDKSFIYRNKRGFGVPLDKWIRNELKDLFDVFIYKDYGFFNMENVDILYREHQSGKYNHQFKLLRIFSFNYWYHKYYE